MDIGIWHFWKFDICYLNPTEWWGWLIISVICFAVLLSAIWIYLHKPDPY